ncbi:hypothetical protein SANTM175S_04363 [Streptomyces antimycoticus]
MRVLAELLKHKLIDVEVWRFGSYSVTHEGWTEYEASSSGMAARILQPAQEPGAQPVAQREETATPSAVAALPVVTGGTRAPPHCQGVGTGAGGVASPSLPRAPRARAHFRRAPRHARWCEPRGTVRWCAPVAPRGEQGARRPRWRHRLEGPETFHSAEPRSAYGTIGPGSDRTQKEHSGEVRVSRPSDARRAGRKEP